MVCAAAEREANAEPEGWFQKTVAGGGSAALLAFLCNKALLPVRVPITVGLTPVVARCGPSFQSASGHSCGVFCPVESGSGVLSYMEDMNTGTS
jgi:Protein of unknown function (DUF1279)